MTEYKLHKLNLKQDKNADDEMKDPKSEEDTKLIIDGPELVQLLLKPSYQSEQ